MGERVRVVRHGGRLLAVKEAGPGGVEALGAEAAVLERVRTAGVVDLVGVRAGDPPAVLTAWVGPRSLADLPVPQNPERAAGLCLAVAGVLERLHRAGIVHGAVEPTHVLLDAQGRPVLCGFGAAGPIGAPVRRPVPDPGRSGHPKGTPAPLGPADDVAGLGRLLLHLLGPPSPTGLRPTARRRAARAQALRQVAEAAVVEEPSARPSLGRLVRSLRRAAPGAVLPGPTGDIGDDAHGRPAAAARVAPRSTGAASVRARPTARGRSARSLVAVLPAAVAVLAVGGTTYLGLSAWWTSDGTGSEVASVAPTGRDQPTPASSTSTTTGRPAPSSTPPTSTTSPTSTTATTSTTTATPDAGGTEAVAPEVVHGGRRYAVGRAGDVVLVGPWLCDGEDRAALLRPGDGSVHLFDGWAPADGRAAAREVATVEGATELGAVPDHPGCAALRVTGPSGVVATLTAADLR